MDVVNATTAKLSLQVTTSAHPDVPAGTQFTVTLHDNGEGQSGTGDYFTFDAPVQVSDQFHAEAGNIQVHYG